MIVALQMITSQTEFESAIKAMERGGGKFSEAILNPFKNDSSAGNMNTIDQI